MLQKVATISKASGPVVVERGGQTVELRQGDATFESDIIRTQNNSVELTFEDGSIVMLGPSATMSIKDFAFGGGESPSFIMELTQGVMRSITGEVVEQNPDAFKLVTPRATVGIRGTDFMVKVNDDRSEEFAVISIGHNHNLVITTHEGLQLSLTSPNLGAFLGIGTGATLTPYTLTPQEVDDMVQLIVKTLTVTIEGDDQQEVKTQTDEEEQSSESHGLTNVLFDAASLGELNAQTLAEALVEELELLEVEVPLIAESSETDDKLNEVTVGEDSSDDDSTGESGEGTVPAVLPPTIAFTENSGTANDGNLAFTDAANPPPVTIAGTSGAGVAITDENSYGISLNENDTATGVGGRVTGTHGILELTNPGNITYEYTPSNPSAIMPGEVVTDNFYVHVTDNGVTTSQQISVSVTGDGDYTFTDTASADDTLSFSGTLTSGTINMGDGTNNLTMGGLNGATALVTGGVSNDTITITGNMTAGEINTLNGSDDITIRGDMSGGTINLHGGVADSVTIQGAMTGGTIYGSGTSTINVGQSNDGDVITVDLNSGEATINSGGGANDVFYLHNSSLGANVVFTLDLDRSGDYGFDSIYLGYGTSASEADHTAGIEAALSAGSASYATSDGRITIYFI